jgi:hypothetical protein
MHPILKLASLLLLFSYEIQDCFATLRPLKFFKRKKEKKESTLAKWRVSKKQVFLKKYYHPDSFFGSRDLLFDGKVVMKTYGWWRFFEKPAGLELDFL